MAICCGREVFILLVKRSSFTDINCRGTFWGVFCWVDSCNPGGKIVAMADVTAKCILDRHAKVRRLENGSYSMTVYPRVHMFSLDLSDFSGHVRHGSMGLSLKQMPITITATATDSDCACPFLGALDLDSQANLDELRKYIDKTDHYSIDLKGVSSNMCHVGLGMSTQILGAMLICCAKVSGVDLKIRDLYNLGVGHTSTLGLSLLFNPGFILEMGLFNGCSSDKPSGVVYDIHNEQFYSIAVIRHGAKSLSGAIEDSFWDKLLPDNPMSSKSIAYSVLEDVLPGIIGDDFPLLCRGINDITNRGTKPAEENIQSSDTKSLLAKIRSLTPIAAVSSMGPTIYAFMHDDPRATIEELRHECNDITAIVQRNGEGYVLS